MSDDDDFAAFGQQTALATVAALDPTGGVATAMAVHVATNYMTDTLWRSAIQDIWADVLIEEKEERRQQYEETQNAFDRQRLIIEWLTDDLTRLEGRIEGIEAAVLGLLGQSEDLLRIRPEPEMRPYLAAAFANATRRRDKFSATWVRRLTEILGKVGAEHLKQLVDCYKSSLLHHLDKATPTGKRPFPQPTAPIDPDAAMVRHELYALRLLEDSGGAVDRAIYLSLVGVRLAEFVTPPEPCL